MNQDEINSVEWANGDNWNDGFYRSTQDNRVWVPKRSGGGTTVNFGNRSSGWAMLGLSIVPLGLLLGLIIYRVTK